VAEPLKATFFAFSKREHRGVLRRAALTHAALLFVTAIVAVLANSVVLGALFQGQERSEPAGPIAQMMWLFSVLMAALIYFVLMASYEAACLRWLIRGETKGFGGFSLAGDTARVWLGQWLWLAIAIPFLIVAGLVVTIVTQFFPTLAAVEGLPGLTWPVAWALLISPLALRLAPGNATSVGRRKFAYFDAWRVTKDRFRALGGSYLIVWLLWIIALVVVFFALSIPVFAVTGDNAERAPLINALMSGVSLLTIVGANMLATLLLAGVNARAVLAAAREGKIDGVDSPGDVARVFE